MTTLLRTPTTHDRALEGWRWQARLVADRWETYLAAGREGRAFAFRAYMAALDAEEAAAAELAGLGLAKVA
jgi:hypothetical protein